MVIDEQSEVLAFLASLRCDDGEVEPAERIDTHTASVFLTGDRALKLKRAVRYDYLDFSSVDRRRDACRAEVALNRRTAPSVYLGAVPIARGADGSLVLDGRGQPVDWLVVMRRFEQGNLLDRMAAEGRLSVDLMPALADTISDFHAAAERHFDHGGAAGLRAVIAGNAAAFLESTVLDARAVERTLHASWGALSRTARVLDRRKAAGLVRRCHGDLHLRNIVLLDGKPTLFDAIEFNAELSCIDVLYDLAFLVMDLLARGLPGHANLLFNRYAMRLDSLEGLAAFPLMLSCRAAIRAKTSLAASALQRAAGRHSELQARAKDYLLLAEHLLASAAPQMIAIGGPSGTGKSTLALRLAPSFGISPGAVVLRSDVMRKALFGVAPEVRLGDEAYTPAVNARVYERLNLQARLALAAGYSVIADAVFANAADRVSIERTAERAGVPFTAIWLDAGEAVLADRLMARHGDASDATAKVLARQLRATSCACEWPRVDASGNPADTERRARYALVLKRLIRSCGVA